MKLPSDIPLIATFLLALLVVAGTLIGTAFVLRCAFAYVAVCEKDFGQREVLAEILVVLMALITRPRDGS